MGTPVVGYIGTGSGLTPSSTIHQFQRAVARRIFEFAPDDFMFYTLLQGSVLDGGPNVSKISPIAQEAVHEKDGKFEHYELQPMPRDSEVTAAATAAATTIYVKNAQPFLKYDIVEVWWQPEGGQIGEQMRVIQPPVSPFTSIVVETRGNWGTATAPILVGAKIKKLGPAIDWRGVAYNSNLGAHTRGQVTRTLDHVYGYCQMFEAETAIDWNRQCAEGFLEREWPRMLQDYAREHKRDVEMSLLLNGASMAGVSEITLNERVGKTAGLLGGCGLVGSGAPNGFTYDELVDQMQVYHRANLGGSGTPIMLTASRGIAQISKWGSDRLQTVPGGQPGNPYGYITGTLLLPGVKSNALRVYNVPSFEETRLENAAIITDISQLTLMYMENLDEKKSYNVRLVGEEGEDMNPVGSMNKLKKIQSVVGLRVTHRNRHMLLGEFSNRMV